MTNAFKANIVTYPGLDETSVLTISGQIDTHSNVASVALQDGGVDPQTGLQSLNLVATTQGSADGTVVTMTVEPWTTTTDAPLPIFPPVIIWAGPVAIFQSGRL
jgi:hypothetical protein